MSSNDLHAESAGSNKPNSSICGANGSNDDRIPWEICQNPAGWGTDHQGEGLCSLHEDDPEFLPEFRLFEPNHGYYSQQDEDDRHKLEKIAYDITMRFQEQGGRVDEFDKEQARMLAIDMHLVRRSSQYVSRPLMKGGDDGDEEVNQMIHQHRRLQESIIDRAAKLGILQDPESKKAQSEQEKAESWKEFVEGEF